jgi:hypothetical protein
MSDTGRREVYKAWPYLRQPHLVHRNQLVALRLSGTLTGVDVSRSLLQSPAAVEYLGRLFSLMKNEVSVVIDLDCEEEKKVISSLSVAPDEAQPTCLPHRWPERH